MRDKECAEQRARKAYVAILELMTRPAQRQEGAQAKGTLELTGKARPAPGDPVIDQYRRKLSMALF
jgi:putative thioredoxin